MNYDEEYDPFNTGSWDDSIANYDEAFVVEQVLKKYIDLGVSPDSIGIITPYWAQVSILRSLIWTDPKLRNVEIRTVDGYQGREKEMIILSFVRSNESKEVGFLEETRRVNVSVTRGKRCCVIIGNSDTLRSDKGLRSLLKFCKIHQGSYVHVSKFL